MAAHWYRELLKYDKEKIISDLGGGDAGKKRLEKLQLASIVKLVPAKSSDSDEVLPEDLEQVQEDLLTALDLALADFDAMRRRAGA